MLNLRWLPVWLRNFKVWRKLWLPSLIGNFGDPLIYLLALGFGLGTFIGTLDGMPYLVFLASGIVCSSAMNAATFEATFSAFTRMSSQKTWEGMLATPIAVPDIIFGEGIWAATKGLINAIAIIIVAAILHLVAGWQALWTLPIIFLLGCCFAGVGLVITAVAKSYDFFTYYLTLVLTPMMLLSGVFFPINKMPYVIQVAAKLLPLYHGVALVRPLMTDGKVTQPLLHIAVLCFYALLTLMFANKLAQKRLIN
jgi:lipooligosaccharide transport system permease protein